MTIGRPTRPRPTAAAPGDLRPVTLHARRPEVGRGLVPDPGRRHGGPVRGDDRGPRPAPPARQGHGLGHRRVLDAAAGDRGADASASRPRAGSAAGPTRSSGSSAARCAASSTWPSSASGRSPSTATSSRPTAAPGPPSITGGYVALAAALITYGMERLPASARSPPSRSGSSTGVPYLDLDYSEDSRAEVDFNVVGTDAGTYVELQGTAEGKPFDRAARRTPARPRRRAGWQRLFEAQAAVLATVKRVTGPVTRGRRVRSRSSAARRDALRAQAARAARAARASSAPSSSRSTTLGIAGEPVEDGATFEANAAIKARFVRPALRGLPTLADDSGLEVDALGGGPGVRTRRYAGEGATDEDNNAKLLAALDGLPPERRGARYVCVLALALPGRRGPRGGLPVTLTRGTCRGRIATRPARAPAASATTRSSSRPREPPGGADPRAVDRRPRSTPSRTAPGRPGGWHRSWARGLLSHTAPARSGAWDVNRVRRAGHPGSARVPWLQRSVPERPATGRPAQVPRRSWTATARSGPTTRDAAAAAARSSPAPPRRAQARLADASPGGPPHGPHPRRRRPGRHHDHHAERRRRPLRVAGRRARHAWSQRRGRHRIERTRDAAARRDAPRTTPVPTVDPAGWAAADLPPLRAGRRACRDPDRARRHRPIDTAFALTSRSGAAADLAEGTRGHPARRARRRAAARTRRRRVLPHAGGALAQGTTYRVTLRAPTARSPARGSSRPAAPPQIAGTLPADETTNVPLDTGIEITFDQDGVGDIAPFFSISPKVGRPVRAPRPDGRLRPRRR